MNVAILAQAFALPGALGRRSRQARTSSIIYIHIYYLSVCIYIYIYICLSVCMSVCLSVCWRGAGEVARRAVDSASSKWTR